MSREKYFLGRDTMASQKELEDTYKKSQKAMGGINWSRGLGRGLGLLGAIALAPTGASPWLLGAYGGLGSAVGSFLGGAYGKHKHGSPAKASEDQLFHRDVAKEQREGVDQYWKGLKEQTAVNALQDAVTAGMYGTKIKEGISEFGGKVRQGMDELKLLGQPSGNMPVAPEILEANTAGIFPDYQQEQLGQYLNQIKQSNAANLMTPTADVAGANIGSGISTTAAPATPYTQGINYLDVSGAEMLPDMPVNELNINAIQQNMNRGTNQRIIDALDVNPSEVGVQFETNINTMGPDASSVAIDPTIQTGFKAPFLQDAVNNTDLGYDTKMRDRILDYMNKGWARDHTINKNMWDQIVGAQNIQIPNLLGGS